MVFFQYCIFASIVQFARSWLREKPDANSTGFSRTQLREEFGRQFNRVLTNPAT